MRSERRRHLCLLELPPECPTSIRAWRRGPPSVSQQVLQLQFRGARLTLRPSRLELELRREYRLLTRALPPEPLSVSETRVLPQLPLFLERRTQQREPAAPVRQKHHCSRWVSPLEFWPEFRPSKVLVQTCLFARSKRTAHAAAVKGGEIKSVGFLQSRCGPATFRNHSHARFPKLRTTLKITFSGLGRCTMASDPQ